MKILFFVAALLLLSASGPAYAQFADSFEVNVSSTIYTDGQPLLVYGTAKPDSSLILRLWAPDGSFAKFDQIDIGSAGSFQYVLYTWPDASTSVPYGTYTLEVLDTSGSGESERIDITFSSSQEIVSTPANRILETVVFVPETAVVNAPIRVYVQVTGDGLLIENRPLELLETSHVHLPDETVHSFSGQFKTLHRGLYFVDYTPTHLGTHVFHASVFYQGTASQGSAASTVMSQDISDISDQILEINRVLEDTSSELDRLKSEIDAFDTTLLAASDTIDTSVSSMSGSVGSIVDASLQLNSLLFPIMGLIAVIVALQIAVLARHRIP
jgi:hypothetical protein